MTADPRGLATRTMFDAIDLHNIPVMAEMVAHYVDGRYAATADDLKPFSRSAKIGITVTSLDWRRASVIDVEKGAMTPLDAREFIVLRNQWRPGSATVYTSLATVPAVVSACRGLSFNLWLARWTTTPPDLAAVLSLLADLGVSRRVVAVQWRNTPGYDESVVFDPKWHPAP